MTTRLTLRFVGPEAAEQVHAVVAAAFGARPRLDPPADADSETPATIGAALSAHGGLLAERGGEPVAEAILDPAGERIYLRRFGVVPSAQGTGVAGALAQAALLAAAHLAERTGANEVAVVAREELPRSVAFWRGQGFVDAGHEAPYLTLTRPLPLRDDVATADDMHRIGSRLAGVLRAGDVVVLTGELGAGKTTFTQGLGRGLGVRGDVTSPTFVISRVHPSLVGGPTLVHVDAYRLGGVAELDDLDLDASLDEAVTVVEWGEGIAEGLSDSRLEVQIGRALAGEAPADGLDPRTLTLRPVGPRWS